MKKNGPGAHFFTFTDVHQPEAVQSMLEWFVYADHLKVSAVVFK